jgi:multidrug resistance efflux pump
MSDEGTQDAREVHVHVHLDDPIRLEAIMAKIDDLQASLDTLNASYTSLDANVRALLDAQTTQLEALRSEISRLESDDAVEDTKLEGLRGVADQMAASVAALDEAVRTAADPSPDQPEEPEEPTP